MAADHHHPRPTRQAVDNAMLHRWYEVSSFSDAIRDERIVVVYRAWLGGMEGFNPSLTQHFYLVNVAKPSLCLGYICRRFDH